MVAGYSLRFQCVSQSRFGNGVSKGLMLGRSRRSTSVCIRRCNVFASANRTTDDARVYVISDLHTDYDENMSWVKSISTRDYQTDVLLVAGDVAESYENFFLTMSLLRSRFKHVLYVPGNHDLWCRNEKEAYHDSLEKLSALLDACGELQVEASPMVIGDLGIIPLFSWYHESFDQEQDITGVHVPSLNLVCKDFHACKWSDQLCDRDNSLAQYFDLMNDKYTEMIEEIKSKCRHVITFSHFVPRQDLCPEKRMLFYPNLPKVIGSDFLESRIRSIHGPKGSKTACHVFGHTHFGWDADVDGVRYVQAPLAYPRERKRRMNGGDDWLPFCIYSNGKFSQRHRFFWSEYYSVNSRDPDNQQLAPWVAKRYENRRS